jgi:ribosomal protein S18 acetylase RimI-like enzyme
MMSMEYKNVLMRCSKINEEAMTSLPDGFSFKLYEDGDEKLWADIEIAIGEFLYMTTEQVEDYFRNEYFDNKDKLYERCLFVLDANKNPVGTCIAWYDRKDNHYIPSIHWIAVNPKIQANGIGRALLTETMKIFIKNGETPVYLHTQPWSYKAIKLYLDFGFYAMMNETFSDFVNEYNDVKSILKDYMTSEYYETFINTAK